MSYLLRPNRFVILNYCRLYTTNKSISASPPEVPVNKLENFQTSQYQECGVIFDKKPFKMELEGGKLYSWCLCGRSKSQPICDGTHKNVFLKIKIRPVRFQVEKSGSYWLCNCKQTKNRPFCDGTHKQQHIQEAIKF